MTNGMQTAVGTRMTLYGTALVDGRIFLFADERERIAEGGTKPVRSTRLDVSWPNTKAGQRAAAAESLRRNLAERDRLGLRPVEVR